jgi:putative membrane protein
MQSVLGALGLRPRMSLAERLLAFLLEWGLLAIAVWAAAQLISGVRYQGWESLVLVALILGLLNALLKPVLLLLTLPLTLLTLGLFVLVLNIGLFWLTDLIAGEVDRIQFAVQDFVWDGIFAALLVTAVRWALGMLLDPSRVARDIAPDG